MFFFSYNSQFQGLTPKLMFQFFNMNLNNAYLSYKILYKEHNSTNRVMTMPEAMEETKKSLLQTGGNMRMIDTVHSPSILDMVNAYDSTLLESFKVIVMVVLLVIIIFDKEQVLRLIVL